MKPPPFTVMANPPDPGAELSGDTPSMNGTGFFTTLSDTFIDVLPLSSVAVIDTVAPVVSDAAFVAVSVSVALVLPLPTLVKLPVTPLGNELKLRVGVVGPRDGLNVRVTLLFAP